MLPSHTLMVSFDLSFSSLAWRYDTASKRNAPAVGVHVDTCFKVTLIAACYQSPLRFHEIKGFYSLAAVSTPSSVASVGLWTKGCAGIPQSRRVGMMLK